MREGIRFSGCLQLMLRPLISILVCLQSESFILAEYRHGQTARQHYFFQFRLLSCQRPFSHVPTETQAKALLDLISMALRVIRVALQSEQFAQPPFSSIGLMNFTRTEISVRIPTVL